MKCIVFFLSVCLVNFDSVNCNEINFVNGIDDIPIFKEMNSIEDSLVIFDTNRGRFVSSEIYGNNDIVAVKSFYEKILPNLGWQKIKSLKYQRDGELLTLKYRKIDGLVYLIFKISPK